MFQETLSKALKHATQLFMTQSLPETVGSYLALEVGSPVKVLA